MHQFQFKKSLIKHLPTTATILACLALFSACRQSDSTFKGTLLDEAIPAADFTLTDQDSQAFTLSAKNDKIILLFFGYAYCPDVCPLTLSTWKQVQDTMQEEHDKIEFVFITVDPERDTVEKLREHLSIYSETFYGLTGTAEELLPVYQDYGVYREKVRVSESAAGYLMNHTARIFLIEPGNVWRLSYTYDTPAIDIVHDLRRLLK